VRLSGEIKEQSIFVSLISSVHDAFFTPKLPPLVLQSKPIAVPDRMATQRSSASTAVAIGAHVVIILLIALFIASQVNVITRPRKTWQQSWQCLLLRRLRLSFSRLGVVEGSMTSPR